MKLTPTYTLASPWVSYPIGFIFGVVSLWLAQLSYQAFILAKPELLTVNVAKVGDEYISLEYFEQAAKNRAGKHLDSLDYNVLLDELIVRQASIQFAKRHNQDNSYDYIQAVENLLIGQLRQQILQPKLDKIKVSEAEIQEYYQANPRKYQQNTRVQIAMLYQTLTGDINQQIEQLNQVRDKALAIKLKDFGPLAIEHSDDQASRYKGGLKGWQIQGVASKYPQAVQNIMFHLKLGEVSPVIQTDKGLYLIKSVNKVNEQVLPFEKVRQKIYHQLITQKQQQAEIEFNQTVLKAISVERYLDKLPVKLVSPQKTQEQAAQPPRL